MTRPEPPAEAATPSTGGQPPDPPLWWAVYRLIGGLAAFAFAPLIGWNWGGWGGLALGFAVAVPLTFALHYVLALVAVVLQVGLALSFGVVFLVVMGFLWIFNRRQFDVIRGELFETPGESVESAAPVAPQEPLRRTRFRLGRVLVSIGILGVWLGVGVAAARAAHTPDDRQGAIALVVVLPFVLTPILYAARWLIRVTDEMMDQTYRPKQ